MAHKNKNCQECGNPLAEGSPIEGYCPSCLLTLGLGRDPGEHKMIGNYEILSEIGRGGMGVVYKAFERSLNRVVALKTLTEKLGADEKFIKRFRREAQAVAAIAHPNIVPIHSVGKAGDTHYFAMEFVKGQDLASFLRKNGPFSPRQAVNLIGQVASVLVVAHEAGVIHRDIKPQNIMIERSGRIRVLDFGLAKRTEEETDTLLTVEGSFLGTVSYASPEQCGNDKIDARTDLYALGVLFFELLTGKLPYTSTASVKIIRQKIMGETISLGKTRPNLSPELAAVSDQLLASELENRTPSAKALLEQLEALKKNPQTLKKRKIEKPTSSDEAPVAEPSDSSDGGFLSISDSFDEICQETQIASPAPSRSSSWKVYAKKTALALAAALGIAALIFGALELPSLFSKKPKIVIPSIPSPFAAPSLDAAVREALGITDGLLTEEDLLKLTSLWAQSREITDISGLEKLKNLEEIYLDDNPIADLAPLGQLEKLKYLHIEDNKAFENIQLRHLRKLNLSELWASNTQVNNSGLKWISEIKSLNTLWAGGCSGVTDEGLRHISRLENLGSLGLWQTGFSDAGLQHLSALTDLRHLNICNAQITDLGLQTLEVLQDLDDIRLDGASITKECLPILARFPNLATLTLNDVDITDDSLHHFIDFPKLRNISLQNCELISGAGLETLAKVSDIEDLQIIGCKNIDSVGLSYLKKAYSLREIRLGNSQRINNGCIEILKDYLNLKILVIGENTLITPLVQKTLRDMQDLRFLSLPSDLLSEVELAKLKQDMPGCRILTSNNGDWDWPLWGPPWPSDTSHFSDLNLERAARKELRENENNGFSEEDLLTLTKLDAASCIVYDLGGLEKCVNLETLDLGPNWNRPKEMQNQFSDLAPLAELVKLRDLSLQYAGTFGEQQVAHLDGLTQLESIGITIDGDASLTRLLKDKKINRLCVPESGITDAGLLEVATLFPKLSSLVIPGCPNITDAGMISISRLEDLTHLNISFCQQITNDGIRNLGILSIMNNITLSDSPNIDEDIFDLIAVCFPNLSHLQMDNSNEPSLTKLTKDVFLKVQKIQSLESLRLPDYIWDMLTQTEVVDLGRALPNCEFLNLQKPPEDSLFPDQNLENAVHEAL